MTPEAQRIAIAKACGWTDIERYQLRRGEDAPWYITGKTPPSWKGRDSRPWLPDFLNDLNAMHEAEKVLTNDRWSHYSAKLWLITHQQPANYECHATASQRARAFLKTLNLWTEE